MIMFTRKLSTCFSFLVNRFFLIRHSFLTTIRQKYCLLCDEPCENRDEDRIKTLCTPCLNDLPWNDHYCEFCSLPLPSVLFKPILTNTKHICGECFKQQAPFEQCVSVFRYDFPIDSLIMKVKYQHQHFWLKSLSHLLAKNIDAVYSPDNRPDLLIPIPLHPKKKRIRGYNQAEIISRLLSRKLKIATTTKVLSKTTTTESQSTLNKSERAQNLKGSFALTSNTDIQGKFVAVVDDVVTTRATVELAATLLLKAGARRVDIWCIARTAKSRH